MEKILETVQEREKVLPLPQKLLSLSRLLSGLEPVGRNRPRAGGRTSNTTMGPSEENSRRAASTASDPPEAETTPG